MLYAEVIVDLPLVDGGGSLGNQLSTQHIVAVPDGTVINCDLEASSRASVGWVLIRRVKFDVLERRAGPMDVVSASLSALAVMCTGVASLTDTVPLRWRMTRYPEKRWSFDHWHGHPREYYQRLQSQPGRAEL